MACTVSWGEVAVGGLQQSVWFERWAGGSGAQRAWASVVTGPVPEPGGRDRVSELHQGRSCFHSADGM